MTGHNPVSITGTQDLNKFFGLVNIDNIEVCAQANVGEWVLWLVWKSKLGLNIDINISFVVTSLYQARAKLFS